MTLDDRPTPSIERVTRERGRIITVTSPPRVTECGPYRAPRNPERPDPDPTILNAGAGFKAVGKTRWPMLSIRHQRETDQGG